MLKQRYGARCGCGLHWQFAPDVSLIACIFALTPSSLNARHTRLPRVGKGSGTAHTVVLRKVWAKHADCDIQGDPAVERCHAALPGKDDAAVSAAWGEVWASGDKFPTARIRPTADAAFFLATTAKALMGGRSASPMTATS